MAIVETPAKQTCLHVAGLTIRYGGKTIGPISLDAHDGEVYLVLGSNGSGKSTLLKAIMGAVPHEGTVTLATPTSAIRLNGRRPEERARTGLRLVQDAGDALYRLTVLENLLAGAYLERDRRVVKERVQSALEQFPALRARLNQAAGTLSGGELRMLSIARACMARPSVLMLDEPSSGLAPDRLREVLEAAVTTARSGVVVILAEQNAAETLPKADRVLLLDQGSVVVEGGPESRLDIEQVARTYLGWI